MAIFGVGGHGAVVADILESLGFSYVLIDDVPEGKEINGIRAISKEDFLELPNANEFGIILAIGASKVREGLYGFFAERGFSLPSIIHKSAIISKSATLEDAIVIMPNAVVNARSKVCRGAIINTSSIVEHDCKIGAFAHIAPNATLCGNVSVGNNSHIGAGSVVIEGRGIGQDCVIGAGSVVIRDVPSHSKVVGNPAQKFLK